MVDHNLEGHTLILSGNIANLGWLDMLPIRFITFEEVSLSITSDDRLVQAICSDKPNDFANSQSQHERQKFFGASDA